MLVFVFAFVLVLVFVFAFVLVFVFDRLILTTAASSIADPTFKPGLYGAGTAAVDRSVHEWMVLCLDRRTGKMIWQKTAAKGKPRDKRHIKATYANSTPATDGKHIVTILAIIVKDHRSLLRIFVRVRTSHVKL